MDTNYSFNRLSGRLSSKLKINGENYLYFGGTAYLGIPQDKEFIDIYTEGMRCYGLSNGTSRGNNVQLAIYDDFEAYAARLYGAEAALITSSGYLAAKLTVSAFAAFGAMRYAPNTHPALWINGDPGNQQDFRAWSINLVEEINNSNEENWIVLSNSLNNLYPEIYDFSFIQQINSTKKIWIIIDDSHGIGILNGGFSALQNVPMLPHVEIVLVASMAKALGVDAGLVLGTERAILQLKQSDEFYGASPPAAAGLYAFINGQDIYKKAFRKLQTNVKMFEQLLLIDNNWLHAGSFPVFLSKEKAIEQRLLKEKILISSFPYPDRDGIIINRIVLSSWHDEEDILKLINTLQITD